MLFVSRRRATGKRGTATSSSGRVTTSAVIEDGSQIAPIETPGRIASSLVVGGFATLYEEGGKEGRVPRAAADVARQSSARISAAWRTSREKCPDGAVVGSMPEGDVGADLGRVE